MKSGDASPRASGKAPGNYDEGLTLDTVGSTLGVEIVVSRSGKNVVDLRQQADVKADVSKVVPGVH
ncbi:hypothetical protein FRB98_002658 [Tulasnella sp. 332]|nr:hypothetical protein FRB98_002658 [Tulasnella sp. 332]